MPIRLANSMPRAPTLRALHARRPRRSRSPGASAARPKATRRFARFRRPLIADTEEAEGSFSNIAPKGLLLYPQNRQLSSRVRVFAQWLRDIFEAAGAQTGSR